MKKNKYFVFTLLFLISSISSAFLGKSIQETLEVKPELDLVWAKDTLSFASQNKKFVKSTEIFINEFGKSTPASLTKSGVFFGNNLGLGKVSLKGKLLWFFKTKNPVDGLLVSDEEEAVVYYTTVAGNLFKLQKGKEVWKKSIGKKIDTEMLIIGSTLFIKAQDNILSVGTAQGETNWVFTQKDFREPSLKLSGQLVAKGNFLFAALNSGILLKLNSKSGVIENQKKIFEPIKFGDFSITKSSDILILSNAESGIVIVDDNNFAKKWANFKVKALSKPSVVGNKLYFNSIKHKFTVLNLKTGKKIATKFSHQNLQGNFGQFYPISIDGFSYLISADINGKVVLLSTKGELVSSYETGARLSENILIDNNTSSFILYTQAGNLFRLDYDIPSFQSKKFYE